MIRRHILQSLGIAILACLCAAASAPLTWQSDIGTKDAQRFTTTLREAESAAIPSSDTTFQWAFPGSQLLLAEPTLPHILTILTMQRSEQPPRTVSLTVAQHTYTIPGTAGIRTIHLLAPASPTLTIDCDTANTSDQTLAQLCLALLHIDSQRVGSSVDVRAIAWLFLFALCISFGCSLSLPSQPGLAAVASSVLLTIALSFPHALSVSFSGLIGLGTLWLAALLLIRWRIHTPWLRIALIAVSANIILKAAGVVSPGYFGTDIGFHAHKYEAALRGHFYQIADGQGLTYPYPPTIYALLAIVALPLQYLWPLERIIHISAVVIDSSTIVLLTWLARHSGWSQLRIALLAILYVILPAGFLLQWQATVAQTIGQWFGVIAVVTSLADRGVLSGFAMALTMVGHFGAFLTLHLSFTLAFLRRSLRTLAWRWWGLFSLVSVVYFSQYAGTIAAQLRTLAQGDGATTIDHRWWQYAWQYGIFGHYNGIFVALMMIGLIRSPAHRLRTMSGLMLCSSAILLVAQVIGDIDTTRYVIAIFPVVTLYAVVPMASLWQSRAGRAMVVSLAGLILIQSGQAWFAGVIHGVRMGFLW